jgi:hypothetical protein
MSERDYKQELLLGFLILTCLIFLSIIVGQNSILKNTSSSYSNSINYSLSEQYKTKIKPEGEKQIAIIVNDALNTANHSEKVELIANWTVANFTSCFWYPESCWDDNSNGNGKWRSLEPSGTYWYNKEGDLRVKKGIFLENPNWIAYYKAGACGELAALFQEIANRTEIKNARIVTSNPRFDHAWNEIWIGDRWMYVDLTIYWRYLHESPDYSVKWFNETKFYRSNCYNVSNVTVVSTNEDISQHYTLTV